MRISTAITRITKEYEKAKKNKLVRKPVSYALYQTWLWANAYEQERGRTEEDNVPV